MKWIKHFIQVLAGAIGIFLILIVFFDLHFHMVLTTQVDQNRLFSFPTLIGLFIGGTLMFLAASNKLKQPLYILPPLSVVVFFFIFIISVTDSRHYTGFLARLFGIRNPRKEIPILVLIALFFLARKIQRWIDSYYGVDKTEKEK